MTLKPTSSGRQVGMLQIVNSWNEISGIFLIDTVCIAEMFATFQCNGETLMLLFSLAAVLVLL